MATTDIAPLRPRRDSGTVTVWFGRARPPDADALHALYERLSPESRRRRFFQPMPRVPRTIASHLCSVDPDRHLVWLARAGSPSGPVIGEVQLAVDPDDPTRAELALAVDDDWSGRGLGRTLVAMAHDLAAAAGVETVTAEVLAENRRCADLLIRAGLRFTVSSGVLEGSGPVAPTGRLATTVVLEARPAPLAASA